LRSQTLTRKSGCARLRNPRAVITINVGLIDTVVSDIHGIADPASSNVTLQLQFDEWTSQVKLGQVCKGDSGEGLNFHLVSVLVGWVLESNGQVVHCQL